MRQEFEFRFAFDVELADPAFEGEAHLGFRLADAGKDDALARDTGGFRAQVLAARDHVHACAQPCQCLQDRLVGIGLHRVADQVRQAIERLFEDAVMPGQGGGGIDVERGADFLRDLRQGHVFGMEDAVAVEEVVHQSRGLERRKR